MLQWIIGSLHKSNRPTKVKKGKMAFDTGIVHLSRHPLRTHLHKTPRHPIVPWLHFSRRENVGFFGVITLIPPTTTSQRVVLAWSTMSGGTSKLEMRLDGKQVVEIERLMLWTGNIRYTDYEIHIRTSVADEVATYIGSYLVNREL